MSNVKDLEMESGIWNDLCGYMNRDTCHNSSGNVGIGVQIVEWSTNTIDDAFTIS